ncbi:MAG: hypothetical protein DMF15_14950 [Verrucomicrobia bacterium]|nr:MAG: hypothetical protein DMF15_14950 [Verrucomicrobiota bacterium]
MAALYRPKSAQPTHACVDPGRFAGRSFPLAMVGECGQPAFYLEATHLRGHAPSYPGTPLRQGSQGTHVRTIQQRLKDLGYAITIDGIFGPGTREAVAAFQRKTNLLADGIVGPKTSADLWAR